MYIDIPANDNLDQPAMASFKETGPAHAVTAVRLWRDDAFHWCAITGWSDDGPVPAFISPIEESGDGPARLLHGGECGLRLALLSPTTAAMGASTTAVCWSLTDATQWAEPFLLCRPDLDFQP